MSVWEGILLCRLAWLHVCLEARIRGTHLKHCFWQVLYIKLEKYTEIKTVHTKVPQVQTS